MYMYMYMYMYTSIYGVFINKFVFFYLCFHGNQVILRADKTTNNFSDRAVLKNLGHWLGMQTLAKNKAILQNVSHMDVVTQ